MQSRDYIDAIKPQVGNILPTILITVFLWCEWLQPKVCTTITEGILLGDSPLSILLNQGWDMQSNAAKCVSIGLLFATAYFTIAINQTFAFIPVRTILPSLFFLLFTSMLMRPHLFSMSLVMAVIFAIITYICFRLSEGDENASMQTFNIGLLLGLTTLTTMSTIVFLLWILVFLYHIRQLSIRTTIAVFMGCALPILYATLYFASTDRLSFWLDYLTSNSIFDDINDFAGTSLATRVYMSVILVTSLYSMAKVALERHHQSIKARYESTFMMVNYLLSLSIILLSPSDAYLFIPVHIFFGSFLIGHALSSLFDIINKMIWCIILIATVLYFIFPNYNYTA